ncbi:MAG: hypothetical protein WBD10_05535 [Acidobacteriaceae bacterium]
MFLKGTALQAAEKLRFESVFEGDGLHRLRESSGLNRFLKGTGFSPSAKQPEINAALAAEGQALAIFKTLPEKLLSP